MFHVKSPSKYRTLANNVLRLSMKVSYPIYTNTVIDIHKLLQYKKEKGLGMNALITKAIADTIKSDPKFVPLNSVYQRSVWGEKIVYYDHVSFSVALDRMWETEMVASTYVLEDVDTKSLDEVDQELRKVNDLGVTDVKVYQILKKLINLPSWLQRLVMFVYGLIPKQNANTLGGIGFTNLGRGGIQCVFPKSPKTLIFGIGGSEKKLVLNKSGEVEEHQVMTLNMTFNHFVVDGMICNMFLSKLREKLENADF